MPWSFPLIVLLGAGAVDQTAVVLPTYELCEATREAVIGLPPLGEDKVVCGVCSEGGSERLDRLPVGLPATTFPS
jgi:hypothetical protein